jgi:hypothetical protein
MWRRAIQMRRSAAEPLAAIPVVPPSRIYTAPLSLPEEGRRDSGGLLLHLFGYVMLPAFHEAYQIDSPYSLYDGQAPGDPQTYYHSARFIWMRPSLLRRPAHVSCCSDRRMYHAVQTGSNLAVKWRMMVGA